MTPSSLRIFLVAFSLVAACTPLRAQSANLADFRTAANAITARVNAAPAGRVPLTGYLGVVVQRDAQGRLLIEEVQPESPAAKAGLKKGDVVLKVGDQPVRTADAFREWVQARGPGQTVKLALQRGGTPTEIAVVLAATSQPRKLNAQRVAFGAELGEARENEGVKVEQVTANSPAATAGLKAGDRIVKVDGQDLTRASRLTDLLAERRPGDTLTLIVRRDGKDQEVKVTLGGERGGRGGGERGARGGGRGMAPGGGDLGPTGLWKKETFRLAIVGFEFPDTKHNDKIAVADWEKALFARGVAGSASLADYFAEQSGGAFRLEGKMFPWVEVSKKRRDYVQGSGTSNKTAPLTEALDKLTARDGKDALKDFDGVLFLYAGERIPSNRGSVYAPQAGSLLHAGRRLPYLLNAEGGPKATPIGGFAKEFGLVLGLPDLAARTENVGSEGLGVWCALSTPFTTARPQHFSAWAKEKLGWIKPTVLDPTVKQKLLLAPIEDTRECYKVLVRPDGSEYFLLENRKMKGFDTDLPGEGLLIWRVVNDRPILEESHGVEGPSGPSVHLSAVPYPSPANNAFTPETTPSSRSPLGGGFPVHITEVRLLPDGRIAFQIGYEYR